MPALELELPEPPLISTIACYDTDDQAGLFLLGNLHGHNRSLEAGRRIYRSNGCAAVGAECGSFFQFTAALTAELFVFYRGICGQRGGLELGVVVFHGKPPYFFSRLLYLKSVEKAIISP